MRVAIRPRKLRAAHIKSRRQRVGNGRRRGDHGRARHTTGGPARARVDDVAVAFAPMFEKLFFGAARRERRVMQSHDGQAPLFVYGVANAHSPAAVYAADRADAAGTGAQQGRANAPAHHRGDAVERIAFADAPQVDFDAWPREANCARFAIEEQFILADQGSRLFDFVRLWDSSLPSQEAPAAAQRA